MVYIANEILMHPQSLIGIRIAIALSVCLSVATLNAKWTFSFDLFNIWQSNLTCVFLVSRPCEGQCHILDQRPKVLHKHRYLYCMMFFLFYNPKTSLQVLWDQRTCYWVHGLFQMHSILYINTCSLFYILLHYYASCMCAVGSWVGIPF